MPDTAVAPASTDPTILTQPPAPPAPTADASLFAPQPNGKQTTPSLVNPEPAPVTEPKTEPPVTPPVPETPPAPAKPADANATPKPPEEYDLKAPEGSLLSAEDLAEIKKDAKEAGLTKEEAEALVTSQHTTLQKFKARQDQTLEAAKKEWAKMCEVDPVIGGEKWQENAELARRGLRAISDPDINKFLNDSGLGNHPMAVRLFSRLGRMFAEDKFVPGTAGATPSKKSPEDVLYGNPQTTAEMH